MAEQSRQRALAAAAALREPTRRRLYRYIERQPKAVSRDEAAAAVGVSRALAAFHLDKLIDVGLLRSEFRRLSGRTGPGAGRTSKLYRRSRHQFALTLPARRYDVLARLVAQSVTEGQPVASAHGPAYEYGRALGARARRRIRGRQDPERLFTCVEDVLDSFGFDPYRPDPGEIRLRNCPFDPIARQYTPVVCGVAQAMLAGVAEGTGAQGLQIRREMQSDKCCGILSWSDQ
jgi:predicted ArsR family transcriptional regulator